MIVVTYVQKSGRFHCFIPLSMIHYALMMLRDELNAYIRTLPDHTAPSYVTMGNVAALEMEDNDALQNTLLVSLVNIEEESALKNGGKVFHKMPNGTVRYENPTVFLNLYLLFSANFPGDYEGALTRLSQTIQFFQSKRVFNLHNTVSDTILAKANNPDNPDKEALSKLELFLDLYTMTFEQINHLWGSLGGKQIPFVMYKVRLVMLREPQYKREGGIIEEIQQDVHPVQENH